MLSAVDSGWSNLMKAVESWWCTLMLGMLGVDGIFV